ncbi:hypothetical protein GW935_03485 [Candidatus Falkowbacteria bacterium]|nr:hypothetical protein [Candidatus Falkowbacteria bacterium]
MKINIDGRGLIKVYAIMVFFFAIAALSLGFIVSFVNFIITSTDPWTLNIILDFLTAIIFFWFTSKLALKTLTLIKKEHKIRRYTRNDLNNKRLLLQKRTLENFKVFLPKAQDLIKTPGVDGMTLEDVHRVYWGNFKLIDEEHWKVLRDFWDTYDQTERLQKNYERELEQAEKVLERLRKESLLQQGEDLLQESNLYCQNITKLLKDLLDDASLLLTDLNKSKQLSAADKAQVTFKTTDLITLTKNLDLIESLLSKEHGLWIAVRKHLEEKILLKKFTGWSVDQFALKQSLNESWQNLNMALDVSNKKTINSLKNILASLSKYLEINQAAEDLLENYRRLQKNLILKFYKLKKE